MGIKLISSILLGIFPLGLLSCQGTEIRRDEIPCKPTSAISDSPIVNGTITIQWDFNRDDKLSGYRIYYGFSRKKYSECVDIGIPTESSPGFIKYTLIGLERGKRYYIALIAYDKNHNESAFSEEISSVAK